jgi:hypothetical protein
VTWLHWLVLTAILVGVWSQFPIVRRGFWTLVAWLFADEPDDIDDLLKASRSDGETTGAGSSPCPPSIPRPGPIRGPLSNGRRNN